MIGIRREDKSQWEARAPLVPEDVKTLAGQGARFVVQPGAQRAFSDAEYEAAGATVQDNLNECPVILGVKEIPVDALLAGKTYLYFSHTIKGQPANMPSLSRLVELGCTLIDYERIVDDQKRRLVFFGRYAGLAGMIDTLWALGRRLEHEGIVSPFAEIQPAHRYADLDHVRRAFDAVARAIAKHGLPAELQPFACGFAGYGQVSAGAQEIFNLLPVEQVAPEDLDRLEVRPDRCYSVVFREEHMVQRRDGGAFTLKEYYDHPDRYEATLFPYLRYLSVLVNAIYWEPRYPRFLTREQLTELYDGRPRLRVIGDITCDIDGSLACTTRATGPDNPVYVYDPLSGETLDGVAGRGPVVLAVDFLPCELPVDSSRHFSESLRGFIPGLARAEMDAPLERTGLPVELQRATIVHRGRLTPSYRYLEAQLPR